MINDFNGIEVKQCQDRIILSCEKYIDRVLRTHGWDSASKNDLDSTKPHLPIPADSIPLLYSTNGHDESSVEHQRMTDKLGFSYRGLLGELMYTYVSCRPDIGYAVITLSKFSTCPAEIHFIMLKKVAKYLRSTKEWGIHFYRSELSTKLPVSKCEIPSTDASLPTCPDLEKGTQLTCFLMLHMRMT